MSRILFVSLCLTLTVFLSSVVGQKKGVATDNPKRKLEKKSSALDIVNQRMAAYNKHDISKLMDTYSDDIQVYTYPNLRIGKKGKAHIRSIFEPLFKEGDVSVTIHKQISQGRYVVNEETVKQKGKTIRYVSIYEVKDGLIKSVRFIRE